MPVRIMSEIEKAWVACAIDSEGTISAVRYSSHWAYQKAKDHAFVKKFYPCVRTSVQACNTKKTFCEHLQQLTGVGRLQLHTTPSGSLVWYWYLYRHENIMALLTQIKPYLILKTRQADTMLDYLQRRLARRFQPISTNEIALVKQMSVLNPRGAKA